MRTTLIYSMLILLVASSFAQAQNTKIVLSSLGKTSYAIVTSDIPTLTEVTASQQLATYLKQVTGADYKIVTQSSHSSGNAIYVGRTDKAKLRNLNGAMMASEEWAIKTTGKDIILTGGNPRGVLYAVYHFLEDHVGIRWWNVSEEYVPNKPTLKINPISRRSVPAFEKRDICLDGGSGEYTPGDNGLWASKNRLNATGARPISQENGYDGGLLNWPKPWVAHTLTGYIFNPEMAKTQPELFAWNGTTRLDSKLCLSNPEVSKMTAEWYDNLITTEDEKAAKNGIPRPLMYNISEADSASLACWEPNCIAVRDREGSESGLTIGLLNDVANKLKANHPKAVFETLAYWNTDTPPKHLKPADNVGVRLCDVEALLTHPISHPLNAKFEAKVKGWGKITKHLHIWDYNKSYRVEEPPLAMEFCLQPDYKLFRASGVKQIMAEMEDDGMLAVDNWQMRAWIMAKLMENPDRDTRQLLYDYTEGYYGQAGKYIREYRYLTYKAAMAKPPYTTQLCNENAQGYRYVTVPFMRESGKLLDKASKACGTNPTLNRRVAIARLSYDRTILRYYSFLLREWLQSGKSASSFPFDKEKAAVRVRKTESEFADFYLIPSKRDVAKNTSHEVIAIAQNFRQSWPLPDFAAGLSKDHVFELTPQAMGWFFPEISPVKDDDSSTGSVLKYRPANADPAADIVFPAGIWHSWEYNGIHVQDLTSVKRADVKNSGYNWYKIASGWKIKRGDKLYLLSWGVQAMVDHVMPKVDVGGSWDICVNVKFEGPAYPNGKPDQPNAVYLERIVLTRK